MQKKMLGQSRFFALCEWLKTAPKFATYVSGAKAASDALGFPVARTSIKAAMNTTGVFLAGGEPQEIQSVAGSGAYHDDIVLLSITWAVLNAVKQFEDVDRTVVIGGIANAIARIAGAPHV